MIATPSPAPAFAAKHARLLTFAAHAVVFAALAWWSWRKWPDPLIDFGRELYVPWQIGRGKLLYRDMASLFGPLSPYVNALWFRLFGVSLTTLIVCNLTIFAATVLGIYQIVRLASDRFVASLVGLTVLLLFGFGQYLSTGNYNFVTPYAHEATHGIALSVAMILAFQDGIQHRRALTVALAGFCFGGVLLTKPETSIAAAAAVVAGWVVAAVVEGAERRRILPRVALFASGAIVLPLAFFAYFRAHMPTGAALAATGGAWMALRAPIATNEFYRVATGLDRPVAHALRMAWMFAGWAAFVAVGVLIARRTGDAAPPARAARRWRLARLAFLVTVILLVVLSRLPAALPLTTAVALAAFVALFVQRRADRARALRLLPVLMWSAFALALLAKIALNVRVFHYGFYLALPATTVTIVFLAGVVPVWLEDRDRDGAGRRFRAMTVWALVAAMAPYLGLAHRTYRAKTIAIGTGADRFYASSASGWTGPAVRDALARILESSPDGATVAVLPEGIMLNYLSRRETPLRVLNLMPPELLAFGEPGVLQSLQAAPPTLVLIVRRDVSEYGYPPFGDDERYGKSIVTWVRDHYDRLTVVGERPGDGRETGIEILRRR